jgi:long-subunit acyl-CoA synthetase (AMP-forming)|tara:strand:+ start:236 stop:2383 length:2148 start_codon:yes stop_codon:yes gene_type:complete
MPARASAKHALGCLAVGAMLRKCVDARRPRYKKRRGAYSTRTRASADGAVARWHNADLPHAKAFRVEPFEGCGTVHEVFEYAVKRHASRPALGERDVEETTKTTTSDGREVEKLRLGGYKWMTFREASERVSAIASGLVDLAGLKPQDKVIIYADTKRDWQLTAQACFRMNLTVVTIYATLGEDGVKHGINQTKASVVVCDGKLLKTLTNVAGDCPSLKHVVTMGEPEQASLDKLPKSVFQIGLDEVATLGARKPMAARPPKSTDIAVLMYTSGTTGAPKGVMLNHSNVCATMTGLKDAGDFTNKDVYLAYLPLAHIMEMAAETVMLALGAAIGYGSPQTLTDTGLKLAPGTRGDAPTLKPTFMVFAPAVLDRVRQAVQAKFSAAKPALKKLINAGLVAGRKDFENGKIGAPFLYNAIIFKKVQKLIGGRVRIMISGSAPLSRETQIFMQTCFRCPVRQGYGLTETGSCGTIASFDDYSPTVGQVLTSVSISLRDWEEGGYRVADDKDPSIGMPRGEVLIGGPVVCQGYFTAPHMPDPELEAKNASEFSVIDGVRYFHTGDVGQFTADGQLMIIDRKKDLVKLQQGEYVALSKVENVLKQCPYVAMAMAYADSKHSYCIAVVVVNEAPLKKLASSKGITGDVDTLCANSTIIKEISSACKSACKTGKLVGFETPTTYILTAEPWTPDNDLVTAAFKLKRQNIVKAFKTEIDRAYA